MAALAAAPLRVAGLCKASLPLRASRPQRVVVRAAASTQDVQVRRGRLPAPARPQPILPCSSNCSVLLLLRACYTEA